MKGLYCKAIQQKKGIINDYRLAIKLQLVLTVETLKKKQEQILWK